MALLFAAEVELPTIWNAGILGLGGISVIRQLLNSEDAICECQK